MTGSYIFTLCVSPHMGGVPGLRSRGGYPVSGPGGVPHLRSGGYPVSGLGGTPSQVGGVPGLRSGGTTSQIRGGTQSQVWGVSPQ